MATITANISAAATLIPVSAEVDNGYYTIDDENVYVTGMSRGAEGRDFVRRSASVDRAVGGTTPATHTSGATLTRYYPDAAAAAGGGVTVDNGTDPPVAVTTIVAAGATFVGDEATLASVGTPTREDFGGGPNATIADGANGPLAWGSSFGPDVVLDRSTPTVPAVSADGVYAVSVNVVCATAMTDGGWFSSSLELDSDDEDVSVNAFSVPSSTTMTVAPEVFLSATFFIPAAGTIRVKVRNHDGVSARDFVISAAFVVKIT